MVHAASLLVAATAATSVFALPHALDARRAKGRAPAPAGPRSSTTEKLAAGIGAGQLATDIAGLVIGKREVEELEARRRRGGKAPSAPSAPTTSKTEKLATGIAAGQLATDIAGLAIGKREFEALEARRRRGGKAKAPAPAGPRSSMTEKLSAGIGAGQLATDIAGLVIGKREFEQLEARRRRGGKAKAPAAPAGPGSSMTEKLAAGIGAGQLATDIAGLVVGKRELEFLEARRRGGKAKAPAAPAGPGSSMTEKLAAGIGAGQLATDIAGLVIGKRELEELEARRRRGGRATTPAPAGPTTSKTEKLATGIAAGQLATDIAGLAIGKREFEQLEARRRRDGKAKAPAPAGPGSSMTEKLAAGIGAGQLATDIAGLVIGKRELEFLEARRRGGKAKAPAAPAGPGSSMTEKLAAGIGAGQLATDIAGLVIGKRELEELEARRRRGGKAPSAPSAPTTSKTEKLATGIAAGQLATDIAGIVIGKRDFEDLQELVTRRKSRTSRGRSSRRGKQSQAKAQAAPPPTVEERDFELAELD